MSEDQCLPLSKLEDVWSWENNNVSKWPVTPLQPSTKQCNKGIADFCHSSEISWEQNQCLARESVPKTLICHDMKGGYLGDRFIHGTKNADEYRFFHWSGVDIFVYFSHHLITLPPPGWINAAHLHSVKILGTFITEWDDGEKVCREILKNDDNINLFVSKLTNICTHYGFDGWLLNIENEVCKMKDDIQKLASLVDKLKKSMKAALPDSLVIWYDSVTIPDGKLVWQNELNSKNRNFFDCCDGIFLNYTWKEENLIASKKNAGDRYHDVFVGVDVFGRNCFGGGGFNTDKALEVARKHDLSVAIFAQGWVHETLGTKDFLSLEYCFWNRLFPHLYLHGPCKLPFKTSFCQGNGLKIYNFGKEVSSNPWFNLSLQQHQPSSGSCHQLSTITDEKKTIYQVGSHGCMEMFIHDAFCGGSSLIFYNPKDCDEIKHLKDDETFLQRVLVCSFKCQSPLLISVVTKTVMESNAELNILLKLKTSEGNNCVFLLQGSKTINLKNLDDFHIIPPVNENGMLKLKSQYSLTDDVNWFQLDTTMEKWKVRHYVLNSPQVAIEEIGVECNGSGSVLLGFLNLQELRPLT